jgi:hypothetical protein
MVASPDYFLNPVWNPDFRFKSSLNLDFRFQIRISVFIKAKKAIQFKNFPTNSKKIWIFLWGQKLIQIRFDQNRMLIWNPDLESEIWIETGSESEIWIWNPKSGLKPDLNLKSGFQSRSQFFLKSGYESAWNFNFKSGSATIGMRNKSTRFDHNGEPK